MARYKTPFSLSFEPFDGEVFRDTFDAGDFIEPARKLAEWRLDNLESAGASIRTVAIISANGRVVDCFDGGCWSSDRY